MDEPIKYCEQRAFLGGVIWMHLHFKSYKKAKKGNSFRNYDNLQLHLEIIIRVFIPKMSHNSVCVDISTSVYHDVSHLLRHILELQALED